MSPPRIDYGPGDDVVCIRDGIEPLPDSGFAPVNGGVYLCLAVEDWGDHPCPECGSTLEVSIDAAGDDVWYCTSSFRKALPSDLAVLAGGRVTAPRKLEPV